MKAAAFQQHGGADVIRIIDLPTPEPACGEVRVRVEACGLNHIDLRVRNGMPIPIPMPHIGGCDVVGVVEALGPGVESLKEGQRVAISPGRGCGRCVPCRDGWDNRCDTFHVTGVQTQGGFAEYAVAAERHCLAVDDAWSPEEWACFPLAALTAWNMLVTKGRMQAGDDVLVQAGSSGIGAFGIQIAKLFGARVWTTCGSDEKVARAKQLGADVGINYKRENFAERILEDTGGRGVDVIFDSLGGDIWPDNIRVLKKGGRMAFCGVTVGNMAELDIRTLFAREITLSGGYLGRQADLVRILKLAGQKKLLPVLDRVFPMEETAAAQRCMEDRKHFGKIVVKVT